MLVRQTLHPTLTLRYAWKQLTFYMLVALGAVWLHSTMGEVWTFRPSLAIMGLVTTALAVFLGFTNHRAYERWWEARKIWGLLVNDSRVWARQVATFVHAPESQNEQAQAWIQRVVYRHIAFVHTLRVFLRQHKSYNPQGYEFIKAENDYKEVKRLLEGMEYEHMLGKDNPPNFLNHLQGQAIREAADKGWLNEFRYMQLDHTLSAMNHIQGRSERIKNTPLPRNYTYFARIFVIAHGTILPFALIHEFGAWTIPISLMVSFVFASLEIVGRRIQDPFENKLEDTPLSALSFAIERNLKEQLGQTELPEPYLIRKGILM